jgi:hypothetical protein
MPKKHHEIKRTWGANARRQYHRIISRAICRATRNPLVPIDPTLLDRISMTKGISRDELRRRIEKQGFTIGERKKQVVDLNLEKIYDSILVERDPLIRVSYLSQIHKILIYKLKHNMLANKDINDVDALLRLLREKRGRKTKLEDQFLQKAENLLVYLNSQSKLGI